MWNVVVVPELAIRNLIDLAVGLLEAVINLRLIYVVVFLDLGRLLLPRLHTIMLILPPMHNRLHRRGVSLLRVGQLRRRVPVDERSGASGGLKIPNLVSLHAKSVSRRHRVS